MQLSKDKVRLSKTYLTSTMCLNAGGSSSESLSNHPDSPHVRPALARGLDLDMQSTHREDTPLVEILEKRCDLKDRQLSELQTELRELRSENAVLTN